ncbi:hypothetical protein [Streptomyces mirabilis]|uniref:hypothetical protein n=1 Tax=Streptomyces mirabilis TaxID=68239 RepID=UPI003678746F
MAKGWKDGDPVPEGFSSDSTVGAARQLILHAMAVRTDVDGEVDVEKVFRAWVNTVKINGPEGSANLLMAAGMLAASAYFELAVLKGIPPGALLTTDVEITEAMLKVMFGER